MTNAEAIELLGQSAIKYTEALNISLSRIASIGNKISTMKNFKEGDSVVMNTCLESEYYNGRIWECQTDSFINSSGKEVVFLKGFRGSFACKFLQFVSLPNQ